jgi:hypothetical protein
MRKGIIEYHSMTEMSRTAKMAVIFSAVGAAVAIGTLVVVVDNQTLGSMFQRLVGKGGDIKQAGAPQYAFRANYKATLVVGEEGAYVGVARGGKEPYTYEWRFSDGLTLTGQNVTRSFDSPGKYYFNLTITDADGKQVKSSDLNTNVF